MMHGDPDLAWEFLFKCSSLVSSGYLWVRRLHASVSRVVQKEGLPLTGNSYSRFVA